MVTDQGSPSPRSPAASASARTCCGSGSKAARDQGDRRLPRPRQPAPGRGGAPPPPGRGRPPPGRAGPAKKSRRLLRQPAELTFRFIADHRGEWPVALDVRRPGGVGQSGYYAWAGRPEPPGRAAARRTLVAAIAEVHAEVKGRYGSPRMTAELNARGHACSENTVARLMQDHGIRAKAAAAVRPHDRLQPRPAGGREPPRPGSSTRPGRTRAWSADITYIPTGEGWLYLAVVEDLFSRMIVGWSMDATMTAGWWSTPWRWRSRRRLPAARGCWPTRTGAASTPASTTSGCSRQARDRVQHERGGAVLGQRPGGELLRQPEEGAGPRRAVRHPRRRRGRASSSTSRCSTTASAGTPRWGTCPRPSSSGRTTRTTVNSVSTFRGEDQSRLSAAGREDLSPRPPRRSGEGKPVGERRRTGPSARVGAGSLHVSLQE